MSEGVQIIPVANLLMMALPVAVVVAIFWRWSAGAIETTYALFRMVLQLVLIGFFLTVIFRAEAAWVTSAVLAVMLLSATWIALRTQKKQRMKLYSRTLASIAIGGGCTLFFVTQGVLRLDPWFKPQFIIPLAGMIFAASMNSVSLAADRVGAELKGGATFPDARRVAFRSALIPTVNTLFAVGLVSLPGMMTGQILSGVDPLIAVRYQIMVMAMVLSASGLSAACFFWLGQELLSAGSRQEAGESELKAAD